MLFCLPTGKLTILRKGILKEISLTSNSFKLANSGGTSSNFKLFPTDWAGIKPRFNVPSQVLQTHTFPSLLI